MSIDSLSPLSRALRDLPGGSHRSAARTAKIAETIPVINAALARGVPIEKIVDSLAQNGIRISVRTLYRHLRQYKDAQAINSAPSRPTPTAEKSKKPEPLSISEKKTYDRSDPEALRAVMRGEVDLEYLAKIGREK